MAETYRCPLCSNILEELFYDAKDYEYASSTDEYFGVAYCEDCCIGFSLPFMDASQLESHYSEVYNAYLPKKGVIQWLQSFKYHQDIRKIQKYSSDASKTLFDIGAGGGHFIAHAAKYGYEIDGCELSPYGVKAAKELYNLNLLQASAEDVQFKQRYDIITMKHVLEHCVDFVPCLQKIFDYGLSNKGTLFLQLPQMKSYTSEKFGKYWYDYSLPYHRTHFTSTGIIKILTDIGFETVIYLREDIPLIYDRSMMQKPSESGFEKIYKLLPKLIRLILAQIILFVNKDKSSDRMIIMAQKP